MSFRIKTIFVFYFCSVFSLLDVDLIKEEHVLEYMYTYFNSSYYQVVGLMDGEQVDFLSSDLDSPLPKKKWNEEEGSFGNRVWQDSYEQGRSILNSFLSMAEDLERLTPQDNGDIVQMRLGCRTITGHNDSQEHFAEIACGGKTQMFLSERTHLWTKADAGALYTTKKINKNETLKNTFLNFVNVHCPVALDQFGTLEQRNSSVPVVYTRPSGSLKPGPVNLTCAITGFYPRSATLEVNLFRDNVLLTKKEGIWSSGVRPNDDHTYQLMKTVTINAFVSDVYRCDVHHEGFPKLRKYTWEVKGQEEGSILSSVGIPVAACLLVAALVVFVVRYWLNRKKIPDSSKYKHEENASLSDQSEGNSTTISVKSKLF